MSSRAQDIISYILKWFPHSYRVVVMIEATCLFVCFLKPSSSESFINEGTFPRSLQTIFLTCLIVLGTIVFLFLFLKEFHVLTGLSIRS